MEYNIFGGNLPAVTIKLNQGESIYTQSGGMTWMSENMEMSTNMKGGLFKGVCYQVILYLWQHIQQKNIQVK